MGWMGVVWRVGVWRVEVGRGWRLEFTLAGIDLKALFPLQ